MPTISAKFQWGHSSPVGGGGKCRWSRWCLLDTYHRRKSMYGHIFSSVLQTSSISAAISSVSLILTLTYVQDWAKLLRSFNDSARYGQDNSNTVKFCLYSTIVLSTAQVHACETWKSTAQIRNSLDVLHRRRIRKILLL